MISFRYHIVSIVAVFLALALGVVIGTTVIKQSVIDNLRAQTDRALANTRNLEDQVKTLELEVSQWNRFGAATQPLLVDGQLTGSNAVIVTQQGVDPAEVAGVRAVLGEQESGGHVTAVLEASPKMGLPDQASRTDLAGILGASQDTPPQDLQNQAATALADRLAAGPPPTGSDDVLAALVQGGFLSVLGGTVGDVGGQGQAVVMLSGGAQEPQVSPAGFMIPLATSLVAHDPVHPMAVVAAQSSSSVYDFVPLVRNDPTLQGKVVTVDDADTMPGRVALVLGLHNLLLGSGQGGDYGTCGSCLPIPRH